MAVNYVLDPPESEGDDKRFGSIGYESNLTIVNLGTIFVTLVIILTVPVLLILLRPCKNSCKWMHTKHTSLTHAYYGNTYLRYLLEGCLDIVISVLIQLIHS